MPTDTAAVDPRWFAEDFIALYDEVVDTDPDIREAYWKQVHNARLWLNATAPDRVQPPKRHSLLCRLGFHGLHPTMVQPDPELPALRRVSVCRRCGLTVGGW